MNVSHITTLIFILTVSTIFGQSSSLEKPFKLDGIRWVKDLHKDNGVNVFSNNGIKGTGLTLSFIGQLNQPVIEAYSVNVDKVKLADGKELPKEEIRTKATSSYKDGWGIELGDDKKSVGIQVDLAHNKLSDFKNISGYFTISRPEGKETLTSSILEDKKGNKETTLGIEVETTMNWGRGRYLLLKLANADKVIAVKILNSKNKELTQSSAFGVVGNDTLKLYVNKTEHEQFKVQIDVAKKIIDEKVKFEIKNISL